jgi:uncharacterized membrane protein
MKTILNALIILFAVVSVALAQTPSVPPKAPPATTPANSTMTTTTSASSPATSTTTASSPAATNATSAQTDDAEMMKQMMEMAKLNENHKLLAQFAGNWSYTLKMWMAPGAPPSESKGTAVSKAIMDGRYVVTENTGTFQMPGADGKMQDMNFKGISTDGYDNMKKKFVSAWVDNMGTGISMAEGTYDAATKTFTYISETEMMPGTKSKMRQTIKATDADHRTFEFFEDRGTGEMKTIEINFTRKK